VAAGCLSSLSGRLGSFEMMCREGAQALKDVLASDEDMALAYLTVREQTGYAM
jgi:hypothetical protein